MGACNYTITDSSLCTFETCCIDQGFINYLPDVGSNAAYLAIFGVFLFVQIGQGIFYKTWIFGSCMAAGLILEVLGYGGRIQMSQGNNIFQLGPFLLYLIPLTIGPAFLSAAIYVTLGRTVVVYGKQFSRFKPQTYTYVFVSFDFVALVLQAVGGALCSNAQNNSLLDTGVDIMIAGLSFQVASLFFFMVTSILFLSSVKLNRSGQAMNPDFSNLQSKRRFSVAFQVALAVATLAIFTRCCFRVAELQGGFNAPLANNQTIFDILEGPMIMLASLALTVFHPGFSFDGQYGDAAWRQSGKKKAANTSQVEKAVETDSS